MLLLDEATSALDAKREILVQHAVEQLSAGRATLVIAHWLAIASQGPHEALVAEDGLYARLARLRFTA